MRTFLIPSCLALAVLVSACVPQNHPLFAPQGQNPQQQKDPNAQQQQPAEQQPAQPNPLGDLFNMPQLGQPGAAPPAATNTANTSSSTSSSHTELCYAHECNGQKTGRKCFPDKASYCQSMCSENNCAARMACDAECK